MVRYAQRLSAQGEPLRQAQLVGHEWAVAGTQRVISARIDVALDTTAPAARSAAKQSAQAGAANSSTTALGPDSPQPTSATAL